MKICRLKRTRHSAVLIVVGVCFFVFFFSRRNSHKVVHIRQDGSKVFIDDNYHDLAKPVLPRPADHDKNGLGEGGKEVRLPDLSPDDKRKFDESVEKYAVNQFISEKISLHRTLKDSRHHL